MDRVLYLFGSAAPPVHHVDRAIRDAQADGWDVCLGLTPTAADWLADRLQDLSDLTGHPVRSTYRRPGEPGIWPPPTVIAVAPATMNTVNQWALGITGTWVVGVAAEAIGRGTPLVAMPYFHAAYARHPQVGPSIAVLRGAGVRVLFGPGGFQPGEPGQGVPEAFPWHLVLAAANDMG